MIFLYSVEGLAGFHKLETDRFEDYPTSESPLEVLKQAFEEIVKGVVNARYPHTLFFFEDRTNIITLYGAYAKGTVGKAFVDEKVDPIMGKIWSLKRIEVPKVYEL